MVCIVRCVLVDNDVIAKVVVEMVYKSASDMSRVLHHLLEVVIFQMLGYPVVSCSIVADVKVTTNYSRSFHSVKRFYVI